MKHKQNRKDQKRSNTRRLLLVLVILTVLVGGGLLAYTQSHSSAESKLLDRQKYVNQYINASPEQSYKVAYYKELYNKGYITAASYHQIEASSGNYAFNVSAAYGRYLCVNSLPSFYKYGKPIISSNGLSATISVTEYYSAATTRKTSAEMALKGGTFNSSWEKVSGNWQLDMITENCF